VEKVSRESEKLFSLIMAMVVIFLFCKWETDVWKLIIMFLIKLETVTISKNIVSDDVNKFVA